MNKKLLTLVILLLFILGLNAGYKDQKRKQSPSISSLPDLTVKIEFIQITSTKNPAGKICYSIIPKFTVSNAGKSVAKKFDVLIEWTYNPSHTWSIFSIAKDINLGPGGSMIFCGVPSCEMVWCIGEKWKPGWRITADSKGKVGESNENNNFQEKIFKPMVPRTTKINRDESTR